MHARAVRSTQRLNGRDGIWTLIGSAILDPRSLRLNFEFNVEIYTLILHHAARMHDRREAAEGARVTLRKSTAVGSSSRWRDGSRTIDVALPVISWSRRAHLYATQDTSSTIKSKLGPGNGKFSMPFR